MVGPALNCFARGCYRFRNTTCAESETDPNYVQRDIVRIIDRKKDMINVSGFKVYPNEVEEVVRMHPGVLDVGAVGVPDALSGEAVKIVVVKRDPALTAVDLKTFCRQYLTAYKIPRVVEFSDELPKTILGKVLRRALHEASI